jgi:Flp pilus assembly protein TadD
VGAGNICFYKGEFHNALLYYTRAVAVAPNDPRVFSNRAAAFCGLSMYASALRDAMVCRRV